MYIHSSNITFEKVGLPLAVNAKGLSEMTPKLCKLRLWTMLDAWDDDAKKYREAGSGGLHTKERCEEMKAKSRTVQGEKNNHGNEPEAISPRQYSNG